MKGEMQELLKIVKERRVAQLSKGKHIGDIKVGDPITLITGIDSMYGIPVRVTLIVEDA